MSYVFFALLAALFFSLNIIISKFTTKHEVKNIPSLFTYFMLANASFGLLIGLFTTINPISINIFAKIGLISFGYLLGFYFFYQGLRTTDASTVAPIFQLQAGIIAILAYIFLGEQFPLINYIWILFALFGAILISIDESFSIKSFFKRGVVFIIIMQIIHAAQATLAGSMVKQIGSMQTLFWEYVWMSIFLGIFLILKRPKIIYPFRKTSPLFLAGFINVLGMISIFKALETNLTYASVLALLQGPIVFVVSILASKFTPQLLEHHIRKVYIIRAIGLVFVLFSAYKISIG